MEKAYVDVYRNNTNKSSLFIPACAGFDGNKDGIFMRTSRKPTND